MIWKPIWANPASPSGSAHKTEEPISPHEFLNLLKLSPSLRKASTKSESLPPAALISLSWSTASAPNTLMILFRWSGAVAASLILRCAFNASFWLLPISSESTCSSWRAGLASKASWACNEPLESLRKFLSGSSSSNLGAMFSLIRSPR